MAIPKPSLRPGTRPGESVTMPGGEPIRPAAAPEEAPPASATPPPSAAPEGPFQAQPEASTFDPAEQRVLADTASTMQTADMSTNASSEERRTGEVKIFVPGNWTAQDIAAAKKMAEEAASNPTIVMPSATPTADEIAERVVEKIRGRVARQMRDPEAAALLMREVGVDPRAAAAVIGELERDAAPLRMDPPTVILTQVRKRLSHPPQVLPDGGISLRYNFDPNVNSLPELRIPENAAVRVKTGFKVSVPAGWIGEVTVAGVEGQRVQVALLSGEGQHELELMLRTNNPHLRPVRAGDELAQLHLRRREPAKLAFLNPFEV